MGTRNVTIVKLDNKIVATKYCQWDGYPTGQGLDLLNFIKNDLDLRKLKKTLRNVTVITEDKAEELFQVYLDTLKKIPKYKDYRTTIKKEKAIQEKLVPTLTRDTGGGKLLRFLQERPELPITAIKGALDYAKGKDDMSFGMEYAYEVDLDKKTVKIYDGLYKRGSLVETLKFANIRRSKTLEKRMEKLEETLREKWD